MQCSVEKINTSNKLFLGLSHTWSHLPDIFRFNLLTRKKKKSTSYTKEFWLSTILQCCFNYRTSLLTAWIYASLIFIFPPSIQNKDALFTIVDRPSSPSSVTSFYPYLTLCTVRWWFRRFYEMTSSLFMYIYYI